MLNAKVPQPGDVEWLDGLIYKWDHAEPLPKAEYDHWMTHILPRGWSIIREPQPFVNGAKFDLQATKLFGRNVSVLSQ